MQSHTRISTKHGFLSVRFRTLQKQSPHPHPVALVFARLTALKTMVPTPEPRYANRNLKIPW
jgi:hypothetical protein